MLFAFCGMTAALGAIGNHFDDRAILRAAVAKLLELGFEIYVPKPFDPRLPVARDPTILVRGRVTIRLKGGFTKIHCIVDVDRVQASSRLTFLLKRKKGGFIVSDRWPGGRAATILERAAVQPAIEQVFRHRQVKRVVLAADAVVHDGGYLRAYVSTPLVNVETLREIADDLEKLADALDENRWLEKETAKLLLPPGATSGASGDPFVIPIR
jgi:hypothetical protein